MMPTNSPCGPVTGMSGVSASASSAAACSSDARRATFRAEAVQSPRPVRRLAGRHRDGQIARGHDAGETSLIDDGHDEFVRCADRARDIGDAIRHRDDRIDRAHDARHAHVAQIVRPPRTRPIDPLPLSLSS